MMLQHYQASSQNQQQHIIMLRGLGAPNPHGASMQLEPQRPEAALLT